MIDGQESSWVGRILEKAVHQEREVDVRLLAHRLDIREEEVVTVA